MSARNAEVRALADQVARELEGRGLKVKRNVTIGGIAAAIAVPTARGQVGTDDNEPKGAGGELDLQQPAGAKPNDPSRANVGRLKHFVERVEKLREEHAAVSGDIRDVYSEAKGAGYDTRTIRAVIRLRRMDAADRAEQETLLDVYKHALGMV